MFVFFLFLIGAAVGGFLSAWAERGTLSGIWREMSRCRNCTLPLSGHHQIPVFSWLLLRGRCAHCRIGIPLMFLFAELAFGLLFVFLWFFHIGEWTLLARDLVFTSGLGLLFLFDLRRCVIPTRIVLPIIALAILFHGFTIDVFDLSRAVFALAAFFGLQYFVSRGRWIGSGDIWMGVLLGALLGTAGGVLATAIAYMLGAAVGMVLLLSGLATRKSVIPLGTFLAVGGWIVLLFGNRLLSFF